MKSSLVQVSKGVVNLSAVTEAHWEGSTLYVHFLGGAFERYNGPDATQLYEAISDQAVDLRTGEVKSAR